METSASCEARSAPSFYPANLLVRIWRGAGMGNLPAYSTMLHRLNRSSGFFMVAEGKRESEMDS